MRDHLERPLRAKRVVNTETVRLNVRLTLFLSIETKILCSFLAKVLMESSEILIRN